MAQIVSPVSRTIDKTRMKQQQRRNSGNFIVLARQADIIRRQCPGTVPPTSNTIVCEDGFEIRPMRVLDQVKKYFISETGKTSGDGLHQMPQSVKNRFHCIYWFDTWLDDLAKKRRGRAHALSTNEIFEAFIEQFQNAPPHKNDVLKICNADRPCVELKATKLLEKLSNNFFKRDQLAMNDPNKLSDILMTKFMNLEWASAYIEEGIKRRNTARIRNVVTKDMKMELMLTVCRTSKPRWSDFVDVMLPDGSGEVFRFYPATWLDDLTENFTTDSKAKPGVVLDEAQKLALLSLHWFGPHLKGLMKARELRPFKKLLFEDDDTEDNETDDGESREC